MTLSFRKTAWAAVLAGTTALTAFATDAGAQSLEEELAGLISEHPQIRAARETVAAAEEGVNQAFADYLPKVQATGNFGYERIDSPGRRTATDPVTQPFTTGQARTATVTITQTLFNGFRSDANNASARANKRAAEHTAETSVQNVLFEAVSAYLEILRNMRLVRLAGDNEETIRLQLQLEDERVRRGAGITVDVLQSKSRLQVAKERRVAFEGSLQDSLSRYGQVFGHVPDTRELVMPTPPLGLLPDTVDEVIEIALAEHPAILSADTQVEIAGEARRIAQADFFPTIDISGEWSYDDDLDGTRGTRRDYKAKVNASWTLFNGFATRAGVAQSAHTYRSSIDSGAFVKRKIAEEVRLAWSGLETARERVVLLQNAVNIAAEVFDARRKLREAGKETVINVLDAESEMFNARINLVAAQHDARIAVYRLMLAMGRLTLENATNLARAPRSLETDNIEALPTNDKTASNATADVPATDSNTDAGDNSAALSPDPEAEPVARTAETTTEPVAAVEPPAPESNEVATEATAAPDLAAAENAAGAETEETVAARIEDHGATEPTPKARPEASVIEPVADSTAMAARTSEAKAVAAVAEARSSSPQDVREVALASSAATPETVIAAETTPRDEPVRPVLRASLRLDDALPASDDANFSRLWPYE